MAERNNSRARRGRPKSFEEALKRLQEIVETLERGEASLDTSMELYEEGIVLSRFCLEKLNRAELRLKELHKNLEGTFEVKERDTIE